ncbi:hypothetical protein QYM36_001978 [Artemia franciscana]|uniref:Uncharacterized protein n=1 Tax=Artemia franciscana TaxID=6661 RepID=A0AA88LAR3_ARTSF|nr:hypothetical protein QYM36_001978 [Artemia franciscana]
MRLKAVKIDYCKAEGLDNSKSVDAFALVDSIVLKAFETGLRSDLQEAVRLRQDDYENVDEALEIAQIIESGKLNPVDILSLTPDDTRLQTRPFSLADEEAEF